ncbi:hypothetical protein [Nocardia sp. NPDC024068]|uniref:hypothetical protein n=1 Tax=Nocardia sp. NPDC024068 TaxID=3157197 RepID=UPI0033CDD209
MVARESQPVLLGLTVPKRAVERGLVDGLAVSAGHFSDVELIDAADRDERLADFLAGAAHGANGYAVRTDDPDRALALIAATAAALCGEDIRAALARPDLAFLAGLSSGAVDAVRDMLLGIETADPEALGSALRAALDGHAPAA